jgi:uncharacterized repeat protein (TIGR03847 family)
VKFEWELPSAERLVVGTIGEPGQRVFYLQAREGPQLVTLKLEKIHVAELSNRLLELIEDWPELDTSAIEPGELEAPIEPDFVVGSLALGFHDDGERVVIVAEELVPDDESENASVARIVVTRAQIAALARHGAELVTAGRAPCPLCGYPLDPRVHVCPRSNGHGPPRT